MDSERIAVLLLLALAVFWIIGAYNRLVRLRNAVVAAWAPIDAQLQRRHELALGLVDALRAQAGEAAGASQDEASPATLQPVTAAVRQARSAAEHVQARPMNAGAVQSLGLAEQVLERALLPLRTAPEQADARPDAGESSDPVPALLGGLQEADAQLAFVRRLFNDAVGAFNGSVAEWPTRLVAALFAFRPATPWLVGTSERGPDSQFGASSFGERP